MISFRIDSLDLFAVQGIFKSSPAPQFKSINFQHSAFFMVQLSDLYMTTGKATALITGIFVSKIMILLFNMPSRFVTAFLPSFFPVLSLLLISLPVIYYSMTNHSLLSD